MKYIALAAVCAAFLPVPAQAAPGLGEKVYGATVGDDVTEIEARYGRLVGDAADGEDNLVIEAAHAFDRKFYGAVLFEFEREPGESRELEAIGFEGIVPLGRIEPLGLDVAAYGEYEIARGGPDEIETKLLLEKRVGAFDGRLNLIAEKELERGENVEFGYAASADWKVLGDIRLGAAAFGELGGTDHFLPRAEHYAGPIVKAELEHLPGDGELEVETGYLFALGAARDETDGQFRLLLEYEFHL